MTSETLEAEAAPLGTEMPSAEFVEAISELLETDPADLLSELGYYERSEEEAAVVSEPA